MTRSREPLLKRCIGASLILSLLANQQGFFVCEALAQQFAAETPTRVSGTGQPLAVAPGQTETLSLGETPGAPALADPALTQGPSPVAPDIRLGAAHPPLATAGQASVPLPAVAAPLTAAGQAIAATYAPPQAPPIQGQAILEAPSLEAPREGLTVQPAAAPERRTGSFRGLLALGGRILKLPLSVASAVFRAHYDQGAASQDDGAPPVTGSGEFSARATGAPGLLAPARADDRERVKRLRRVLGDGPPEWNPFVFNAPRDPKEEASNAGLQAFLDKKLEHRRRWGLAYSLGQLEAYFGYADGLLAAAGLSAERQALREIKGRDIPAAQKDKLLDGYLSGLISRLRSSLAAEKGLSQAVEDGPAGWQPFLFSVPQGPWERASKAGLVAFLGKKLENQQRWGQAHMLGQLEDYFKYVESLLDASGLEREREDLRSLRARAIPPADKDRLLNEFLQGLIGRLRPELNHLRAVRRALEAGPSGWGPFRFDVPQGPSEEAPNVGLEGFLYAKLQRQRRLGQAVMLGQLDEYFSFVEGLLAAGGREAERRGLHEIKELDIDPADKDDLLNQRLTAIVNGLRAELRASDPSLQGRNEAIYMILARAYQKLQPGQTIFDVLDDAELLRIKTATQADTLWLLDIFEIGEVNRWGVAGGSPYSIRGYHVKAEHGGDAAFKGFVARAHRAGLKVMVDYIPNHYSLDSELLQKHPEAFIHMVPPQPNTGEDPAQYRRRVLDQVPRGSDGWPLYHLIESQNYPEGGQRVRKFVLVHYPFEWGYKWSDMAQIDYSHPVARAWQVAQARRLFEEFGIDGIRRDMSYFEANDRFFPHWTEVLRWERDGAQGWVRGALDAALRGFEERAKAVRAEFLEEMIDAIREENPAAFVIDEVYSHQRDVSRAGSNGLYNKVGLYEALLSRDPERIRAALREVAFAQWQLGAAALVNFPTNHDAYEGNPVDKFGPLAEAVLAATLMFQPTLFYNGLELMAGRDRMLIRDGTVSEDDGRPLQKMIPFDARAWIAWANADPARQKFLKMIVDAGRRNRDLFRDGLMEVLEPEKGARSLTAWISARTDPATGAQRALLVASNWSSDAGQSWTHFRFGDSPLGGFKPREDRRYVLKDWANPLPDGSPTVYPARSGHELAGGITLGLRGGGVHVFEIEELPLEAPSVAPPVAAPTAVEQVMGAAALVIPFGFAWNAQDASPWAWVLAAVATAIGLGYAFRHRLAAVAAWVRSRLAKKRQTPGTAGTLSPIQPEQIRISLDRQGQPAVVGTLASIDELLRAESELARSLRRGPGAGWWGWLADKFSVPRIRIVIDSNKASGGLTQEHIPWIAELLESRGFRVNVEVEKVPVQAKKKEEGPAGAPAAGPKGFFRRWVWRPITWPFREAWFLASAMISAYKRPTLSEVFGGFATKSVPFAINVGTWLVAIGTGHPLALAAAILLSLSLESFHGVWINTWNNFQNVIYNLRSGTYQILFNWLYMQATGALFRLFSWLAHPDKVVPPWAWEYWAALGFMSVIGTMFGALGYQGLNKLQKKRRINTWQRSAIQQIRDLLFLIAGPFFAAGAMDLFWVIFLVQQGLDLGIFLLSLWVSKKPGATISDPGVAESEEFRAMYPEALGLPEESALKQAGKALLDNPLVWPFAALYKLVTWPFRGAEKK